MKRPAASLIAIATGWLAVALGVAAWQLGTRGSVEDLFPIALGTGSFAFLAWLLFVVPLLGWGREPPLLFSPRWSWLGWALLAMTTYVILVATWVGREAFELLWYPAAIGGIAGPIFTRLTRDGPDS